MFQPAKRPASKVPAASADPDAIKEKKARNERFFWKQVTVENTAASYQNYLERFPEGEFVAEARRKIDELAHPAGAATATTNPPSQ